MEFLLQDFPKDEKKIAMLQSILKNEITSKNYKKILKLNLKKILKQESEFYRHLSNKKILKKQKIRKTIEEAYKEEDNENEKMVLGILINKKVTFINFRTKLYLEFKFRRLESTSFKNLSNFNSIEDRLFELAYIKTVNENQHPEINDLINKELVKLEYYRALKFLILLKDIINEETINHFLPLVPVYYIPAICDNLPNCFEKIASSLIDAKPVNKIKIIHLMSESQVKECSKVILKHFVLSYYENYDISNFNESIELLKILPLKLEFKIQYFFGWLRSFLYSKNLNDFIEVFKSLDHLDIENNNAEFNIFKAFIESVAVYKSSGELDLEKFKRLCRECRDDNEYALHSLISISSMY